MAAEPDGATPFSRELAALLEERGLSWRKLAQHVGYTAGWLSKIRHGRRPSEDLARRCDEVLGAGGRLLALAAADPAPAAAPPHLVRPAQLPGVTIGFVGRQSAIGQLNGALQEPDHPGAPHVVAVDGPPGVGKTALALRWAHSVARLFPDGQLYVDLHGYSSNQSQVLPQDALEKFLVALGCPLNEVPRSVDERAALYRTMLSGRRTLVILDNAADFSQVEPLLPGSSECVVVVTSRSRLFAMAVRTHATRVTLEPLSDGDSVLLLRTAIGERADAEAHVLDELAVRCGHLPLALRIVAEQAVSNPHIGLEQLLANLVAERRQLEVLSPDEPVAVRTVFSWSYRKLDPESRRMFRLLSLHPGVRISPACAAALCARPPAKTAALLEKLHSMHLLEALGDDGLRLPELLRLYAAERVLVDEVAESRRQAVERMVEWYIRMVSATHAHLAPFRTSLDWVRWQPRHDDYAPAAFDDAVAALRWCDSELSNLMPVSELAAEHGLRDEVVLLGLRLFDYLILRKPWSVWILTHELAQKAALETGDDRAAGWIKTHLAYACWWLRDCRRSRRLCEEALVLLRRVQDRPGEGWALENCAITVRDHGDLGEAHDFAVRALDIFTEAGSHEGQAAALGTLCDIETRTGRPDAALTAARDSLQICEEIRDYQRQGRSLIKVGIIYQSRGDSEQALRYAELAVGLHRSARDRWGEAESLARQGDILHELGHEARATASWGAALNAYSEMNDPRVEDVRKAMEQVRLP
ncbi:ATP-binding protein [Streptomyces sp. NPDC059398]|uniref:ATP-binding protein n=1 Tax=Streptomyces sp. NPDC059398 TaxID=3346820 RepID=UPI0036BE6E01